MTLEDLPLLPLSPPSLFCSSCIISQTHLPSRSISFFPSSLWLSGQCLHSLENTNHSSQGKFFTMFSPFSPFLHPNSFGFCFFHGKPEASSSVCIVAVQPGRGVGAAAWQVASEQVTRSPRLFHPKQPFLRGCWLLRRNPPASRLEVVPLAAHTLRVAGAKVPVTFSITPQQGPRPQTRPLPGPLPGASLQTFPGPRRRATEQEGETGGVGQAGEGFSGSPHKRSSTLLPAAPRPPARRAPATPKPRQVWRKACLLAGSR